MINPNEKPGAPEGGNEGMAPRKPEQLSDDDLDDVTGGQRCTGSVRGITDDDAQE